jgi:hypothetical protein
MIKAKKSKPINKNLNEYEDFISTPDGRFVTQAF